jgi:hypothetical protein
MDDATERRGEDALDMQGAFERRESAMGDDPGAPTWPIPVPAGSPLPPPVGLNWGTVAQRYGADVRTLMHDGYIVLAGEYVPETGYFVDPQTLRARRVDVGQRVLEHGYLIGRLTADEFPMRLEMAPEGDGRLENVVVRRARGPVIGLFADRRDAERCRDTIVSGAIGSGVMLEDGPLGTELRVASADVAGRVATAISGHGGAVISVGGAALTPGMTSA